MDLPRQDVNIKGCFAAFTVRPPTKFNPVKISAHKVSRNDQVFAVRFGCWYQPNNKALQFVVSHRSRGFVTNARVDWFCHDCVPRYETYEGDPIFNKQDEFVGITIKDRGIAIAFSISYLTKLLDQFHNGMVGKVANVKSSDVKQAGAGWEGLVDNANLFPEEVHMKFCFLVNVCNVLTPAPTTCLCEVA
ncbi:uncharacterized protein C2845_PM03G00640 [Panicum miliaceum]|uniref:Uncharacterized protein n=1 Tax=Panicum miliaceum TaxID=4540 RepID=A0A3L6TAD0_PANMI|nr:uncharacterized protein C2845_PM03G00640 [Panicum miliaceum]